MFRLIETKSQISACQRQLEHTVRAALNEPVKRNIGYPSDTLYGARVHTDGTHWYHSRDQRDEGNPRRLNWFGLYTASANLQISVEINVPFVGRNDQIAGFFLQEPRSGEMFLAHSGRVGGGTAGVGKTSFLAWTEQRLIEAEDSEGGIREGIIVMPLSGSDAIPSLIHYVDAIVGFKAAVRAGETATAAFQRKKRKYEDYYEEARGRRRGMRRAEIDYITRHGDIVSALSEWREARPNPHNARFVKDILIDLGLEIDGELIELYEAKSSADRSSVYAAIGQLFVHGRAKNCKRYLTIPVDEQLSDGLPEALQRLGIDVLRFRFKSKGAVIVS